MNTSTYKENDNPGVQIKQVNVCIFLFPLMKADNLGHSYFFLCIHSFYLLPVTSQIKFTYRVFMLHIFIFVHLLFDKTLKKNNIRSFGKVIKIVLFVITY